MSSLPQRVECDGHFKGVRFTEIAGNGSCLFASISLGLFGTPHRADMLRAQCVQYVCENWLFFDGLSAFPDVNTYRSHMSKAHTWGESCEASALSSIYHRRIIIIANGSEKLLDSGPTSDPSPIFLRYSGIQGSNNFSGSHYDLYSGYPANFDLRRDDDIPEIQQNDVVRDSIHTAGAPHLVASGSICCKDPIFFSGAGDGQSVVISTVALASQFLKKDFNEEMIDRVIHTGDTAFNIESLHKCLLSPQDLPEQITVNDPPIKVTITEKTHLTSYMYPHSEEELTYARKILLNKLTDILQTSPPASSFLFQTPRGTSAFWQADDVFLVFDPNGSNESGHHDDDDEERNLARLFECAGLQPLVQFLLQQPAAENGDTEFFDVHRLRFCLPRAEKRKRQTPPPTPRPSTDGSDSDTPLSARRARGRPVPQKSRVGGSDAPKQRNASPHRGQSRPPLAQSGSDSDTPLAARVPPLGSQADIAISDSDADATASQISDALCVKKRKVGRPKKLKRGRKVTSHLSQRERHNAADKRYRDRQRALKNKTRNEPDVNHLPPAPDPATQEHNSDSDTPLAGRIPSQKHTKTRGRPKTSELTPQEQQDARTRRYRDKKRAQNNGTDTEAGLSQSNALGDGGQLDPTAPTAQPTVPRGRPKSVPTRPLEQHQAASAKEAAAEAHRERQRRYVENNATTRRETQQRYRAAHPDANKMRHLTPEIRKAVVEHGPAAFWSGAQLNVVQPHQLIKPNLYADDIFKCQYCGARLFEEEPHTGLWCCGKGAYNVLDLPPLQAEFYESPVFLERARAYNDMLAFCAMGVSGGYRHPSGLSFLKIEGRLYHQVFSLSARGQSFRAAGGQQYINHCRLYIDDGEERRNLAEGRGLNPIIIDAATSHILANNPYVEQFRLLHAEESLHAHLEFQVNTRSTHGPVLGDRNPGAEVHAVLSTDERLVGAPRQLTVWKHSDRSPSYISVFSALMEPFQYPLLYPEGTLGWSYGRVDNKGNKLSQYKYARCLLLSEPRFSELGRLSQAWQVEMFARYEEEQLRYVARSQGGDMGFAARIAPASELQEHVQQQQEQVGQVNRDIAADVLGDIAADETIQGGNRNDIPPGKIFLPSTHTGSQRYMKKKYMNAMALVSRKGGPTYFLTFTACGQWSELKRSTRHGDKCDPATCCRIFHIKLKELLRDIRSGALFGPNAYLLYVIEMQMRGLPHAHIAIRVADGGPTQARDIDRVIRADVPGPEEAGGRLREMVLKHMLHGPCGTAYRRTDLPCWDAKKQLCDKHFPKPHCETTHTDSRGFVLYRRNHQNTATVKYRRRDVQIHDGWIVPYNPYLLLKYDAHINLELASTRRVIKYLFKYLHKGNSKQNVRVSLANVLNEPVDYVTKRVIGASDACWRLLDFDLTVSEPAATVLPVHLKGEHNVIFRRGNEAQAAATASPLMLYFDRPAGPVFDHLTYQEFHENFITHTRRPRVSRDVPVYDHPSGKHFLTPRQRGECVTRLFWVSPNRGEQYYLRVLLSSMPCRGEDDLKARAGPDCQSLQEAARHLGLVDNEQEYSQALREAGEFMVGPRLRDFFVMLANIGAPVALLWEEFRDTLCEDFLERHPDDPSKAYKLGLIHIDRGLRKSGSSVVKHGLPDVRDDSTELGRHFLNYSEDRQREILQHWEPLLSQEQRAVLQHVRSIVEGTAAPDARRTMFLDGPGGYGKTLLLNNILAYLRSVGKVALCVATSGIAALNMEGGATAHSMFRLPLDLGFGTGTWNLTNRTQRAELIRAAELIIFDEAPMAHRHMFEMIDRSLRDLMNNNLPFGGKMFLCSGDFRQIAPVVERARSPSEIIWASLKSSELWPQFQVFKLTVPQRTRGSREYSDFLLSVGDGTIPERTFGEGQEKETLIGLTGVQSESSLPSLIDKIYPDAVLTDPDKAAERAILASLNVNVKEINDIVLARLEGQHHQLLSYDEVDKDGDDGFSVDEDTLHLATAKGVPDHVLTLKTGAVCLITRNLNIEQGLVNGTKVIVEAIGRRLVRVRKPGSAESFGIPRIAFQFPIVAGSPLQMTRRQFPLQLAYAMTVHKSQGQTIRLVGVDLRTDCFAHGQLYVALSRVRSPQDIHVLVQEDRVHDGVAYTKNIVYHDLLH